MRGRVTDEALAALADQTARHQWHADGVELTVDPAFRGRLADRAKGCGCPAGGGTASGRAGGGAFASLCAHLKAAMGERPAKVGSEWPEMMVRDIA